MGRKSKKKANRLPKWMSDDGVTIRKATDLEEEMAHIEFPDGSYYTKEDRDEIENFMLQYGNCIWNGLGKCPGPHMEVVSSEAEKEARGYTLWNGKKHSEVMDKKQWTMEENLDVIVVLLVAESLQKNFENVLSYIRFIKSIIIECDKGAGESTIVEEKEQAIIKRYLHSYWMLQQRGIFVQLAKKNCENVWEVPETGQNVTSKLIWH